MRTRTGTPITDSEKSHYLIRRLGSQDAAERESAQAEFLRMATHDPALFQADLADIIRHITGSRKRMPLTVAALAVCLYVAYMAPFFLGTRLHGPEMLVALLWAAAVLLPIGITGSGISWVILGRHKRRLAECITGLDELTALPSLIELLQCADPTVRKAILPPLTRLLLRLHASDAHLLGFLHRAALARALSAPSTHRLPSSFYVAILHAIEQIGDSQALPNIAWLAQGRGAAHDHPAVQDAAQRCLLCLQEQIRRHQAPYLLLRPSSLAGDSHALLQPAGAVPDTALHELLHAVKR